MKDGEQPGVSRRGVKSGSGTEGRGRAAMVLPWGIYRYVIETSAWHQTLLVILTIAVFLLQLVPLELQRRIVNDAVKHRNYRLVVGLCLVYVGVVLAHGGIKLAVNIYRGWIAERATYDLRQRIHAFNGYPISAANASADLGVQVSMMVAEVEPIGRFVGEAISEPLLQGGILLSVAAYMIHLQPWIALTTLALFVPQLVFVPLLQGAINRRTETRVRVLRELSVGIVAQPVNQKAEETAEEARINEVFSLDMGIFRVKFTMNFLMNLCGHLQIIAALLLGSWYVLNEQLQIGGIVAFISAISRLNDPWGDLVNYFREINGAEVKFRLVADAINRRTHSRPLPSG